MPRSTEAYSPVPETTSPRDASFKDGLEIRRIVRHEDGVVQVVHVGKNMIVESFCKALSPTPPVNAAEPLQNVSPGSSLPPPGAGVKPRLRKNRAVMWIIYIMYNLWFVALAATIVWGFNPHVFQRVAPNNSHILFPGGLSAFVPRNFFSGCKTNFYCHVPVTMPPIHTPKGTVFANFTSSCGTPANYHLALILANHAIRHHDCFSNFSSTDTALNTSGAFGENVSADTKTAMAVGLLLLQSRCHPEVLQLYSHPSAMRKLDIRGIEHVKLPRNLTCPVNWAPVFKNASWPDNPGCNIIHDATF
ncbi:envelope glycoprotein 48 [Common bottlenose dolphin gammaherpesvirus 1 strain Sarasota]|uniref:Envelope glycoprotein 48 n=1 Tax=Common bottlenose dolphin gammaherpesvirus 1 strain Sarasota TaxID=2022783 RepID=A0A1Z1NEF7_9GAMA|nr:envelope glycoprotein 48 [Common bottlenose dolphin gammaherpesvirus 1 strain Sarasota]ARW78090.1 envelope glycoprotein 48 [Common bottlenose dolphin gammaherpesvirus 1 strain Sarasota]